MAEKKVDVMILSSFFLQDILKCSEKEEFCKKLK